MSLHPLAADAAHGLPVPRPDVLTAVPAPGSVITATRTSVDHLAEGADPRPSDPAGESIGTRDTVEAALDRYLQGVLDALARATTHAAAHGRAAADPGPGAEASRPDGLEGSTRLEHVVDRLVAGGGKLVRPRVVFLGHLAGAAARSGGDVDIRAMAESPDLIRLGCALELLHIFGLLQDDVMDEAATRRGHPAAHRSLADAVTAVRPGTAAGAARPPTAARRFGESLAVLAGDLAFALAGRELRGLPAPVLDVWDDTVLELVQGQRLDMVYAIEGRYDIDDTLWVAMAKSGAYTVARPLQLGALLAAPEQDPPEWLTSFGRHIGMAFALADDVLGVWGDPAVTGKPVGDDLRQAKPTTVLGIADGVLDGAVARALGESAGAPSDSTVAELMAAFDRHGVRALAERRLRDHLAAAEEELARVPFPEVRAELHALATDLVARQS